MFVLPEWSLQYAEEACKLRDDQTLNAAVFTSQPEQISHQRLHLQRQTNKKTLSMRNGSHVVAHFPSLAHC